MTKRQIREWVKQRARQNVSYWYFLDRMDRSFNETFLVIHEKGMRYAKLCLRGECGGVDCLCSSLNRAKSKARRSAEVVRRSTGKFW